MLAAYVNNNDGYCAGVPASGISYGRSSQASRLTCTHQLLAKTCLGHIPSVALSRACKLVNVCHLHHQLAGPEPAMMGDSVPQGTRK